MSSAIGTSASGSTSAKTRRTACPFYDPRILGVSDSWLWPLRQPASCRATALAQQWEFEPIVRVGGEYDDNATLSIRTDDVVELTGLLADLKGVARYSSQRTTFDVQPRVIFRRYDADENDADNFDAEDLYLRSTLAFRRSIGYSRVSSVLRPPEGQDR